jgi:small ubiquitin-related modifier
VASDDTAAQEQQHDTVTLTIRDQNGHTKKFRIKTTVKVGRVIDEYCSRTSVVRDQVRFLFDGERLNSEMTPKELNMDDGDTIDCMRFQVGGGGTAAVAVWR